MKAYKSILVLSLLILSIGANQAQEYLKLQQDGVIYDVDLVVFARQLAQPSAEKINNQPIIKSDTLRTLPTWDGQQKLLVYPAPVAGNDGAEWEIPLSEKTKRVEVLSWVELDDSMNHAIINRLQANPSIKPLLHKKWRQPPSAFRNPQYIAVSNLPNAVFNNSSTGSQGFNYNDGFFGASEALNIPDFSVDGEVAFSRQKFSHLHVNMNLYRLNSVGETLIYRITQQKQIDMGQWQYFDHPQFGVLIKVSRKQLKPE